MPTINGYADLIRDWDSLFNACRQNAGMIPGLEAEMVALEEVLGKFKDVKNQQEQLEGTRLALTQQLRQVRDEGYEVTRRLRSFVRSRLGTRNEHLVQFKVAPVRRRKRSKPEIPDSEEVKAAV